MGQFPKLVGDRYPTSRYSVFSVKSVSGQICGQKFFAEAHGGGNARKTEILRAFGGRLMRRSHAPKAGALPPALHLDIVICNFLFILGYIPCFVRPLAVPVISSAQ